MNKVSRNGLCFLLIFSVLIVASCLLLHPHFFGLPQKSAIFKAYANEVPLPDVTFNIEQGENNDLKIGEETFSRTSDMVAYIDAESGVKKLVFENTDSTPVSISSIKLLGGPYILSGKIDSGVNPAIIISGVSEQVDVYIDNLEVNTSGVVSMIKADKANVFILGDSTVLTSNAGSVITASNSNITIGGGTIEATSSTISTIKTLNSDLTITGESTLITGNIADTSLNVIQIENDGANINRKFTLSGATIRNTASNENLSVIKMTGGSADISGGKIYNGTADGQTIYGGTDITFSSANGNLLFSNEPNINKVMIIKSNVKTTNGVLELGDSAIASGETLTVNFGGRLFSGGVAIKNGAAYADNIIIGDFVAESSVVLVGDDYVFEQKPIRYEYKVLSRFNDLEKFDVYGVCEDGYEYLLADGERPIFFMSMVSIDAGDNPITITFGSGNPDAKPLVIESMLGGEAVHLLHTEKITLKGSIKTALGIAVYINKEMTHDVDILADIQTTAADGVALENVGSGTVTIKDATILASGTGAATAVLNHSGGKVKVTSGAVCEVFSSDGYTVWNGTAATFQLDGGTIKASGKSTVGVWNGESSTVNIKSGKVSAINYIESSSNDGTFVPNTKGDGTGIYNYTNGKIEISGGTVEAFGSKGVAIYTNGGTVNITEADKINAPTVITSNARYQDISLKSSFATIFLSNGKLNVGGGTVENTRNSSGDEPMYAVFNSGAANIMLYGNAAVGNILLKDGEMRLGGNPSVETINIKNGSITVESVDNPNAFAPTSGSIYKVTISTNISVLMPFIYGGANFADYFACTNSSGFVVRQDSNGNLIFSMPYTVTYVVDGEHHEITVYHGELLSGVPDVPKHKTGFMFSGWFSDNIDGKKIDTDTYTVNSNITLYARYDICTCEECNPSPTPTPKPRKLNWLLLLLIILIMTISVVSKVYNIVSDRNKQKKENQ